MSNYTIRKVNSGYAVFKEGKQWSGVYSKPEAENAKKYLEGKTVSKVRPYDRESAKWGYRCKSICPSGKGCKYRKSDISWADLRKKCPKKVR